MVFSHSRLKTYEDCPRKYAFKYVEETAIEERQSVEAFMGKSVHDVLEKLYDSVRMERTPKWEEIRDLYEDYWNKNWNDDILIVRREFTATDYRNVGRRCLQDYFVGHYPFREGRILGLEEFIHFALDENGEYKLRGVIDRLAAAEDGTIEIHDYKTSMRIPSQEELGRERQLALYQIGLEQRWPDLQKVKLIWHYLRANRSMVSVRSRASLDELKSETIGLIDTIHDATGRSDFPPHESNLCSWCEFQPICPAKRHLFATAAMSVADFSADAGVQLADQYVEASRRADQAELELETARSAVIAFAQQSNVTRLAAHNATVGISRRTDTKLPEAGDPNRKALESLVRDSGRWDQVSDLSKSKLVRAIQGDLFDPALRASIGGLLVPSEVWTVRKRLLAAEDTDDGPDT